MAFFFWKCGSSGFLKNKFLKCCRELHNIGTAYIQLPIILFTRVTQQAFLFPSLFYSVILQSVGVGMVCTVGGAVVGTVAAQQEIVIIAKASADSYFSLYVALLYITGNRSSV